MQINPRETLLMALGAVWSHKLRSGLTVLGVVIGITTVVSVASLLAGVKGQITAFFKQFGPNSIYIARVSGDPSGQNAPPSERRRRPFEADYAERLRTMAHSLDDVAVSMYVSAPPGTVLSAKVPGFESDNMSLVGQTPNLYAISPRGFRDGRLFSPEESRRAMKVAVLGADVADALFPAGNAVGRPILVDGTEYTVIGVFEQAKGGFFGENGMDREVVIPLTTAHLRYPQSNNYFITANAKKGMRDDAIEEIRADFRKIRGVQKGKPDDFSISTPDSIIKNINQVTSMIVIISIAISCVGLLVGGIGVMNIMLVSVTERTREIGVRKALGARRFDIIGQFLAEAMALTGFGGIVGILFSVGITLLMSAIFPSLPAEIPTWAVVTGFTVSVGVGVFFGVWPAVLASRLDPVEALRYE